MIKRATPYIPLLKNIFNKNWADAPMKYIIAGQISQESGWKERAEFETSREYGFGFSQCTIAFYKNGKVRFNNFLNAKRKYPIQLNGWTWEDRFNATYNLTYSVLTDHSNFIMVKPLFKNDKERWAGTLVSYNAGYGAITTRRSICKLTEGCDYLLWFGGLDSVRSKTEENILYGKPLWLERNNYPVLVFNKSYKYQKFFQ